MTRNAHERSVGQLQLGIAARAAGCEVGELGARGDAPLLDLLFEQRNDRRRVVRRVHVGLVDGDQHWHALHHKGAQRQQIVQNPAA